MIFVLSNLETKYKILYLKQRIENIETNLSLLSTVIDFLSIPHE